ncbi:energy transducer TonB [Aquirhabdus sp.]|uniref:energy transducer TonB n=1 Tax=Aquirhabdus sp. TaxID=2824160 RepID=UPI00396CAF3B
MKLILALTLTSMATLTWAADQQSQDSVLNYAVTSPQPNPVEVPPTLFSEMCTFPRTPDVAYEKHLEGTTVVWVRFGVDSKIIESKVVKSSGYRELDDASIAALDLCKFKPIYKNGVVVEGQARLSYKWKL